MKRLLCALFAFVVTTVASGASFAPLAPDEAYGPGTMAWRFASGLSKDANGVIELGYAEEGSAERILGSVDVRPFRSSEEKMPDLRILFSTAAVEGGKKVILLVSYGLRSGTFVSDVPSLTAHSLSFASNPAESPSGEFTLLGYGDGPVTVKSDGGMVGLRGRLFFRYVRKG